MKNTIIIVVLLIVVGAGAFFAGVKYQQSKQPAFLREGGFGQGQRIGQGNRQGFRPVRGEIISADEKSITVKLQDGSSKIVLFSKTTNINKAAKGTKDDLKKGEQVMVLGKENSDGSVTASDIQLNPGLRGGTIPNQEKQ